MPADVNSSHTEPNQRRTRLFACLLLLLGLCFITNFFYYREWGLYEDDYIWIMTLPPLNWSFAELSLKIKEIWLRWVHFQCRPVGFSANVIIAYAGSFFSSLGPSYLVGYCIFAANSTLLFFVTNRAFGARFAWVAVVTYFTFPADTSKQILMHRHVHVSETLLLVALLLFQRRHTTWAYIVAGISLATYESLYLPFIAAPFIASRLPNWREILRHGIVFSMIAIIGLYVRSLSGDDRAELITGGLLTIAGKMASACVIGLGTASGAALHTIPTALSSSTNLDLTMLVIIAALLVTSFCAQMIHTAPQPTQPNRIVWIQAIIFAAAVAFSYVLAFRPAYYPPVSTIGRASGVNVAAAVPFGIFFASLDRAFLNHFISIYAKRAQTAILLMMLACWSIYGVHIQRAEYSENWQRHQKPLWLLLIENAHRMEADTPILVDMKGFPSTPGFPAEGFVGTKAFSALSDFIAFPSPPTNAPRVFGYSSTTPHKLESTGLKLSTPIWNQDLWPTISNETFYHVAFKDGKFTFTTDPISIGNTTIKPRDLLSTPKHLDRALRTGGSIVFEIPKR